MTKPAPVRWLSFSFRTGAGVDALAASALLAPAWFGQPALLTGQVPDVPERYALGLAGALMAGWTVLLLWADQDPMVRRDVLLITILVILLLMVAGLYGGLAGLIAWPVTVVLLFLQSALVLLFAWSYRQSRVVA